MRKIWFVFCLVTSINCYATIDDWQVSLGFGTAFNYDESINVKLDDRSNVRLDSVEFQTKPFEDTPYFSVKATNWASEHALEVEYIHHKLYAKSSSLSGPIDKLEFANGYNLLYANYVIRRNNVWNIRAGVGVVITRPEMVIDNENIKGDYGLTGYTFQLGMERELITSDSVSFSLESKVTHSRADVDFDGGSMSIPNTALHLLANIKYRL